MTDMLLGQRRHKEVVGNPVCRTCQCFFADASAVCLRQADRDATLLASPSMVEQQRATSLTNPCQLKNAASHIRPSPRPKRSSLVFPVQQYSSGNTEGSGTEKACLKVKAVLPGTPDPPQRPKSAFEPMSHLTLLPTWCHSDADRPTTQALRLQASTRPKNCASSPKPSPPETPILAPHIFVCPETPSLDEETLSFWAAVELSTRICQASAVVQHVRDTGKGSGSSSAGKVIPTQAPREEL